MLALKPAWRDATRVWVTLPSVDIDVVLRGETVELAYGPTNRNLKNLLRNTGLAWRILQRRHPEAILSTGAGLSVPFFLVGKLLRIRLVYVESVTRIETVSLSGRLVYPLAHRFFVQWPQVAKRLRRAEYAGVVM